jgi:hypothetical protein
LYLTGGARAALGLVVAATVLVSGVGGAVRYATVLQRTDLLTNLTFGVAVVGILAVIPHKYRRLTDPDERRRVRWVVYGSGISLLPNLWYTAVALREGSAGPGPGLSLFTNASSVAIPICMAYVIAKHRILDIRVVVRRGLQYLLARRALQAAVALPLLVLAYTIVVHRHRTIAEIVTENGGYLFWIAAAGAGLRFRRPIQIWLDRRFFREQLDREQLLLGLLDDVGKLDSLSELSRLVTGKLDSALHPKTIYLWYRDPREFAAASSSDPLLTPPDFPSDGRWLVWLEAHGATMELPAPAEASLSPREIRWFAEREVNLIVPVTDSGDRIVGALLVGDRKSEEPYDAGDRRLLLAIAKQTAVVRENLRLRARVSGGAADEAGRSRETGWAAPRPLEGMPGVRRVLRRPLRPVRARLRASRPLPAGGANYRRPLPTRPVDRKGRQWGRCTRHRTCVWAGWWRSRSFWAAPSASRRRCGGFGARRRPRRA